MSSHSYISITQKPISLIKLKQPKSSSKHKLLLQLLPSPRRAGRFFVPFLAIWALLNFSQLPLPPLSCGRFLPRLRPPLRPHDEFWRWAQATTTVHAQPCLSFSESYRNTSSDQDTTTATAPAPAPGKYMIAVVSGGLNQQRNQIIDAVVVARILKAALVVPVLQVNQVWGDER